MNDKNAKMLFITHDAGLYGASRSLKLLLSRFAEGEVDLVVARRPFRSAFDEERIRSWFGPAVRRIRSFYLPLDYCYRGQPGPRALRRLYEALLRMLWMLHRKPFLRMLEDGGYTVVHLNSLTLHRLITPGGPWVLHVREILDRDTPAVRRSLESAAGVIFIDQTTQEPFRSLVLRRQIVLDNPIDMMARQQSAGAPERSFGFDPERCTVFSMIGKITDDKGVAFVISCFRRLASSDARLLIAGGGEDRKAIAACRKAADGDPRIQFLGEDPDIERMYRVTDFVVRGEPYFCAGRSVYEGFYAGCGVIVPGDAAQVPLLAEYARFRDRVHCYAPRSEDALLACMRSLAGVKVRRGEPRSNVDDQVRLFRGFIASLAAPEGKKP